MCAGGMSGVIPAEQTHKSKLNHFINTELSLQNYGKKHDHNYLGGTLQILLFNKITH